jgi:hypothetical protein
VFCFSKSEDAEAFAKRFGGIGDGRPAVPLNQAGDPSALFRTSATRRTSVHIKGPDQLTGNDAASDLISK